MADPAAEYLLQQVKQLEDTAIGNRPGGDPQMVLVSKQEREVLETFWKFREEFLR